MKVPVRYITRSHRFEASIDENQGRGHKTPQKGVACENISLLSRSGHIISHSSLRTLLLSFDGFGPHALRNPGGLLVL